MEMYFCPLYSGSSGNVLFCQYGRTRLLIDSGKPGRCITDALRLIGVGADTINGVLITHEHSDHISGAGVLARKYHIPVYATEKTWKVMADKIGPVAEELKNNVQPGRSFQMGDLSVLPFSIPHDAADPVGYRLSGSGISVSTATDLGYFAPEVFEQIKGSSLVLLESNHDPDMLLANPKYSPPLKRRILGNTGHLSNEACAKALLSLVEAGTRHIILGHLSGENNTPDLALQVSREALLQRGVHPEKDILLQVALRDEVGHVYTIRK